MVSKRGYEASMVKEACRAPTLRKLVSKPVGGRSSLLHEAETKKDKSRDVIANMEARLAKVKVAMVDNREEVDLIK